MNNLRANLKYHEDCGGWGCESVGCYIPYDDVKEAVLDFKKYEQYIFTSDKYISEEIEQYFRKKYGVNISILNRFDIFPLIFGDFEE